MKKKSIYNLRLANHFFRLLAQALEKQKQIFPKPITISRVDLTADLLIAKIYFTNNDFKFDSQILVNLQIQKPKIKMEIAKKWKYKKLPELFFFHDQTLIEAEKTSLILNKNKLLK